MQWREEARREREKVKLLVGGTEACKDGRMEGWKEAKGVME